MIIKLLKFSLIFFTAIILLRPLHADAVTLSFSSSADNYKVGDIFEISLQLDTEGEIVNTADIQIGFSPGIFEVLDVSSGGSVLKLFAQGPAYSNETGEVSFIGGMPGGFNGEGSLVRFFVRADKAGLANAFVKDGSKILLNDGKGTKANIIIKNTAFNILAADGSSLINEWADEIGKDSVPPEPFFIEIVRDASIFEGQYFIVFFATDNQSGLDRYEIKEGALVWKAAKSPYLLEIQDARHKILVKALDKAGNERIEEFVFAPQSPPQRNWIIILIILAGMILLVAKKIKARGGHSKIPILLLLFFISCFFPLTFISAQTASLNLAPYSGTFFVGNTFDVSIFVNTEGNVINAAEIEIKFPPDLLQVTSPTAGASFISVWADQPSYSNKSGTVSFKGGVPSPGIKTSAGLISTITFRAKSPGIAKISFSDSSKILLADGRGTDILSSAAGGEYNLVLQPSAGPKIYSPTHPSQNTWYNNNNPVFVIEEEGSDFSYSIDQNPSGTPDNLSDGKDSRITLSDIASGIWYFHAKAQKNGVWSGVSHYLVKIDTIAPNAFETKINRIGPAGESKFFAFFESNDSLSGIDHYEVSVANTKDAQALVNPFFIEAASPYQIPQEKAGHYAIFVRAYDKAGNFTQSQTTMRTFGSLVSFTANGIQIKNFHLPAWLINILILLIVAALALIIYRIFRKRNLAKQLKTEVAEAEKEIEDVKRFEKRLQDMRSLEQEARAQSERLAEKLTDEKNNAPPKI